MDGEDGEESDLQLLHPLSVSPPNVTFIQMGGYTCFSYGLWDLGDLHL